MDDRTELIMGLIFLSLIGFSFWKSSTSYFALSGVPAQQSVALERDSKKTPALEDMREARKMAKKTVQAGLGGSLPPQSR